MKKLLIVLLLAVSVTGFSKERKDISGLISTGTGFVGGVLLIAAPVYPPLYIPAGAFIATSVLSSKAKSGYYGNENIFIARGFKVNNRKSSLRKNGFIEKLPIFNS